MESILSPILEGVWESSNRGDFIDFNRIAGYRNCEISIRHSKFSVQESKFSIDTQTPAFQAISYPSLYHEGVWEYNSKKFSVDTQTSAFQAIS